MIGARALRGFQTRELERPTPFANSAGPPCLAPRSWQSPPPIITDAAATPTHLKRSVMLLGNFDCFHRGHQSLLAAARHHSATADLPLGIMSVEPHPRQLFDPGSGPFRLSTPATKHETLARMGFDFVFSPAFDHRFAGQSAETFVREVLNVGLSVSHVVSGDDFRFGTKRGGDSALLRRMGHDLGFGVSVVNRICHRDVICSTSHVRELIRAGDIAEANVALGYRWSVEIGLAYRGTRTSGRWSVGWPGSVLKPAPGRYSVAMRGVARTAPEALGEIAIGQDGEASFSLARGPISLTAISGASRLFVEFISGAASVG